MTMATSLRRALVLALLVTLCSASEELTCSTREEEQDPALQEMTYDVGDGPTKGAGLCGTPRDFLLQGQCPRQHQGHT